MCESNAGENHRTPPRTPANPCVKWNPHGFRATSHKNPRPHRCGTTVIPQAAPPLSPATPVPQRPSIGENVAEFVEAPPAHHAGLIGVSSGVENTLVNALALLSTGRTNIRLGLTFAARRPANM